jgi:hypothetical protein
MSTVCCSRLRSSKVASHEERGGNPQLVRDQFKRIRPIMASLSIGQKPQPGKGVSTRWMAAFPGMTISHGTTCKDWNKVTTVWGHLPSHDFLSLVRLHSLRRGPC